jgi:hypothetical protein
MSKKETTRSHGKGEIVGSKGARPGKSSTSSKDAKAVAASALTQGASKTKERWTVSKDGKTQTYTTSPTSTRVIEGAAKRFSNALKRLADR